MNIGDKIFLLYTHRATKKTCEGPCTVIGFLDEPLNDEGTIIVEKLDGKQSAINLEGTSSHEIDVHLVY